MIDVEKISDAVLDESFNRLPKCKQHHENCLNFMRGKCNALWNSSFIKKDIVTGKRITKMCPFYKVDLSFKYVVWDVLYKEVVDFAKTFDDARIIVRVYSGRYYSDGFDDERFKITSWKGDLYKIERDIKKEYEN